MIEKEKIIKLNCKNKINPNKKIMGLTNDIKPPKDILNKLKEFGVTYFEKQSCSYKYCLIATGEFDVYVDKVRAREWDDAAGQAIAEHAGAIVTTLDGDKFKYGKEDYRNPTILIKRSENLND